MITKSGDGATAVRRGLGTNFTGLLAVGISSWGGVLTYSVGY